MTARVDHVGVVVASMKGSGAFLREMLGLELMLQPPPTPDGVRTAFYGAQGARVELIEVSDPVALAKRLAGAQARIEHIAIEVDDVREMSARLRSRGVGFTTDEPVPVRDTLAVWTVPETSAGIIWQLFSHVAR